MNQRNQFDKKDSLELGNQAEELFSKIALSKGYSCISSTAEEDIREHWDLHLTKGNGSFKIDVKAMKRVNRKDLDVQEKFLWLEFHSVRHGDRGWLYDSKADFIAFERSLDFIVVKRRDVIKLGEKLIDFNSKVEKSDDALYKVYSREVRPDKMSMILYDDLFKIPHRVWQKI